MGNIDINTDIHPSFTSSNGGTAALDLSFS